MQSWLLTTSCCLYEACLGTGFCLVIGVILRAAQRVGECEAQLVLAHVALQVVHAPQQLLAVRCMQRIRLPAQTSAGPDEDVRNQHCELLLCKRVFVG